MGAWLRSLARFARVLSMDQRGIGLSDRMTQVIDLETKVDDVRAVLDAADSPRTTLYGQTVDGGATARSGTKSLGTGPRRWGRLVALRMRGVAGDPADAFSRAGPADWPFEALLLARQEG